MTLLPENCSYSEFFWSVFSRIRSENRPEKLRIRTFFTQCPPLTDLKISGGGDFTGKSISLLNTSHRKMTQT